MLYEINELQSILQKELPEKRFYHTLGVAHTAACLSMRYGCDLTKARYAGLLHDCAKCYKDKEILNKCHSFSIPVSETQERQPALLHGKLGAYYANVRFNITDEDILNAVTYHTTGRAAMSLLEKIVFIADYVEPGRKEIEGLKEIRSLVFEDIDQVVYLTLHNTLAYLQSSKNKGKEIDEMTFVAYDYYKAKLEKGKMHKA